MARSFFDSSVIGNLAEFLIIGYYSVISVLQVATCSHSCFKIGVSTFRIMKFITVLHSNKVVRRASQFHFRFSESEERRFHCSVLHFLNSVRVMEKPGDLLHFVNVCTDTTNVVTAQYLDKGESKVLQALQHQEKIMLLDTNVKFYNLKSKFKYI